MAFFVQFSPIKVGVLSAPIIFLFLAPPDWTVWTLNQSGWGLTRIWVRLKCVVFFTEYMHKYRVNIPRISSFAGVLRP